jgi:hypothetical protein
MQAAYAVMHVVFIIQRHDIMKGDKENARNYKPNQVLATIFIYEIL